MDMLAPCRLLALVVGLQLTVAARISRLGSSSSGKARAGWPAFTPLGQYDSPAPPRALAALQTAAVVAPSARAPGSRVSARQLRALLGGRLGPIRQPLGTPLYGGPAAEGAEPQQGPRGVLGLADAYGTEYVGPVGVGTARGPGGEAAPEAVLRAVYDTGSADLWVASDLCGAGACTRRSRRRFNHSRSETFRAPGEPMTAFTVYGSGRVEGLLGADDVRVGPVTVRGQSIGLITAEAGSAFDALPLDGIVGLGLRGLSSSPRWSPLFESVVEQRLLPRSEFSFYLHPEPSLGGAILWGGSDPRLYEGPLEWFPVTDEGFWALDLVSFRVGNSTFTVGDACNESLKEKGHQRTGLRARAPPRAREQPALFRPKLIVDSGTTFFTAAGAVYDAITEAIRPTLCKDVAALPPLEYTIRDSTGRPRRIPVPPEEYMVRDNVRQGYCFLGVVPQEAFSNVPMMILGELFMRYHFTTFRRRDPTGRAEVGMARASHGAAAQSFFAESRADGSSAAAAAAAAAGEAARR